MRGHLTIALAIVLVPSAGVVSAAETTFSYGGYVKMDVISTYYRNGDVTPESPLRDFHLPSQIPVGAANENYDLDFHVKESRFHFQTVTTIDEHEIKGYLELDFMLSGQGDEKVSNSFNPRLRHFYLATGSWLLGQTWTTFMIVIIPDDIDFTGAGEGIVFIRQPQIRFTKGSWQFSLENPETVVTDYQGSSRFVTESGKLPDLVARRNFKWDRCSLGIAAVGRQLFYKDPDSSEDDREFGYGITVGSEIKVGERDDLRFQATAGQGLGRYVALNYIDGAVLDANGKLNTIGQFNGFVSYRHFWNERLWSSANISLFTADNDAPLTGGDENKDAQSYSVNLLYSPFKSFTLGVELMHARRVLEGGTDGAFDRLQFAARYDFDHSSGE